jgi:hypothetical protein
MRYSDEVLADMDAKVKTLSGDHYETLKAEFVDFHNDMRVASVRELTDLGVPYEAAENCLYYVQEVARGMDPNMRQLGEMAAGPMEEVAE